MRAVHGAVHAEKPRAVSFFPQIEMTKSDNRSKPNIAVYLQIY